MSKAYLGGPAEDAAEELEQRSSAAWTDDDQANADFVSDLACEISAEEDVVHEVLGALAERGLFDWGAARRHVMAEEDAPRSAVLDEVIPHSYSPDYQAMGDCRVCGNMRQDCDRFQAELAARAERLAKECG